MEDQKHRMTITMDWQMYDMLLILRCRPEYRHMSIGALIRMLIEKGLEEQEK